MNPPDIRLDALGFPIPHTFDDVPLNNGEPSARRPAVGTRAVRVALVALAIGAAIMAVVRAELGKPVSKAIADWLAGHGQQKLYTDDLEGAVRDLDRALAWNDKSPAIFALRAQVRQERGDLHGSLADFNKCIDLAPQATDLYVARAVTLQRMKRHGDAIGDLSQALRMHRNSNSLLSEHRYSKPELLNARAYTRAVAGLELEDALNDINDAIAAEGENSHFLDTRGYIHFLRGDHQRARDDLDKALVLAEENRPLMRFMFEADSLRTRMLARMRRIHEQELAVIYHHSGEIHEKLGNLVAAEADLRQGDKLGYNPEAGIY